MKTRVAFSLILILLLWPAAHHLLVRGTGLSPWKGFGLAMYTVPQPIVGVGVRDGGGKPLPFHEELAHNAELSRAYWDFQSLRKAWGVRQHPDALARAVFDAFPNPDRIEIEVVQVELDRRTAMLVETARERHSYDR